MFAYCGNNPVMGVDSNGDFWNVLAGAIVGGAINFVSATISEIIEGDFDYSKDISKIVLSTAIGAAEGAALAACPTACVTISAFASAADTALCGIIDGDDIRHIVTDSIISGTLGAVVGSGGSDFLEGGNLLNDAAKSFGKLYKKGIHPTVKKSGKKTIKQAGKYIGHSYASGQIEDVMYGGIEQFASFTTNKIIDRLTRE